MKLAPQQFIDDSDSLPTIDVLSPGEYRQGHIPNAVNIPLFDDEERAQVGKVYKRQGQKKAIELGLEIVNPKRQSLVDQARRLSASPDILVHCWRGGMRSEGVANLLSENGFQSRLLIGGYKAYRQEIHRQFCNLQPMVILSGLTGAGKTVLLKALHQDGAQVIDLEHLACHRGSAFGGIDQPEQPTVEQFENNLFDQWRKLDRARPLWLEDESRKIGKVVIAEAIWNQMREAPIAFLQVEREARVEFLRHEYTNTSSEKLIAALARIEKRLGGERLKSATHAIREGDNSLAIQTVLDYYDKAYFHARERRTHDNIVEVKISRPGDPSVVTHLRKLADQLLFDPATIDS